MTPLQIIGEATAADSLIIKPELRNKQFSRIRVSKLNARTNAGALGTEHLKS